MTTGEHKVAALAIAEKPGIFKDGDTVIIRDELDKRVSTATVFSRVSSSDKLHII